MRRHPDRGKTRTLFFEFAFEYDGEKLPDEAQPQIPKDDFRGVTASSLLFSLYKVQHKLDGYCKSCLAHWSVSHADVVMTETRL
jgi:hypothetical protein